METLENRTSKPMGQELDKLVARLMGWRHITDIWWRDLTGVLRSIQGNGPIIPIIMGTIPTDFHPSRNMAHVFELKEIGSEYHFTEKIHGTASKVECIIVTPKGSYTEGVLIYNFPREQAYATAYCRAWVAAMRGMTLYPGSDEAIEAGCRCPVLDNCHGHGITIEGKMEFIISCECEVHNGWRNEKQEGKRA